MKKFSRAFIPPCIQITVRLLSDQSLKSKETFKRNPRKQFLFFDLKNENLYLVDTLKYKTEG